MRILLILMILMLTACSSPAPAPQDHFYRLPSPEAATDIMLTEGVLLVEPLRASGLVRERSLVYVKSEDSVELERYNYHLWDESPSYMLQHHLADYLRRSDSAGTVTTAHALQADTVISGDLNQFMQIHAKNGDKVVVGLELRLEQAGHDAPVFQQLYTEYEAVKGSGMTAVVKAFNRALNRIYHDFLGTAAQKIN